MKYLVAPDSEHIDPKASKMIRQDYMDRGFVAGTNEDIERLMG